MDNRRCGLNQRFSLFTYRHVDKLKRPLSGQVLAPHAVRVPVCMSVRVRGSRRWLQGPLGDTPVIQHWMTSSEIMSQITSHTTRQSCYSFGFQPKWLSHILNKYKHNIQFRRQEAILFLESKYNYNPMEYYKGQDMVLRHQVRTRSMKVVGIRYYVLVLSFESQSKKDGGLGDSTTVQ